MTEPTVHQNHDHVYTGVGDNPAKCYCGGVHQPDTTQRDELPERERIAWQLHADECGLMMASTEHIERHLAEHLKAADAVLAVRDEELEEARNDLGRLRGYMHVATSNRDDWRRRAEADETTLAEIDRLHVPGDTGTGRVCMECGRRYPCRTAQAASRAREGDHTGAAPEGAESGTVERADGTEDGDGDG